MAYKWKPSASQRKAFAEKMQDPQEQATYNEKKEIKADKRRAGSRYNYNSAGGNYVPTQEQYNASTAFFGKGDLTNEQEDACRMVMSAWICQDKIHHDYIHVVNELIRGSQNVYV